jgi:hypothetical protein
VADLVHRTEAKIRVPQTGEPFWQTVCGIRFAGEVERIATSDDRKMLTCPKCQSPRKLKAV